MTKASIRDERLGLLQWDESLGRWSVEIDLGLDHSVELHITGSEHGPSWALLERAKCLVARFRQREKEHRYAAASHVLACYNDAWNDGPPLSHESFANSLELDSIAIVGQGIEVAYLPINEDMFGGHFILCTIDDDDTVSDVHLAG